MWGHSERRMQDKERRCGVRIKKGLEEKARGWCCQ